MLYFENGSSKVVFAVVQFDEATSYSQNGGFISKSVSTSYSIQTNDAVTGEKLNDRKIKKHRDIKNHPVEIMGAAGNYAWVFMNEPMVFDAFTLETIAAVEQFEEKNPFLKGKFPAESRYYRFDNTDHNLYITAKDGTAWMLDGRTFKATPQETSERGAAARLKQIEKQIKENLKQHDSLMEAGLRKPSRQLAAKEIDLKTFRQLTEVFNQQRNVIDSKRDSLYKIRTSLEDNNRSADELLRRIESMERSFSFSQAKLNGDTISGRWFGVYSEAEMDDLYERFSYNIAYDETARRQWFSSPYKVGPSGEIIIDKDNVEGSTCLERYLNGGFLVDNQTGKPVRLADGSRLIIYKNQVGNEGKIQLAKVDAKGVAKWTADSGLTEWSDFIFTGKQLIITAKDNKELSGSECNILLLFNLENGRAEKYDYFTQKKVTDK